MKTNIVESLKAVDAMVVMLEEREWAEHVGVCPLSRRLETAITGLHNEIAAKNKECEKYETDNQQAVEFLSGQAEGVGELAGEYRNEIWRLRDGINSLLNAESKGRATAPETLLALRDLAVSNIQACPPLQGQVVVGMDMTSFEARHGKSVWDGIIDDQEEREDLKKRSALLMAVNRHVKNKYPLSTVEFLRDNVGYSTGLWAAIQKGHIDELEYDVLLKIATDIGVELP